MLNQSLYYTIQYLEPNTKSKGGWLPTPLVADGRCHNSLVACRLTVGRLRLAPVIFEARMGACDEGLAAKLSSRVHEQNSGLVVKGEYLVV